MTKFFLVVLIIVGCVAFAESVSQPMRPVDYGSGTDGAGEALTARISDYDPKWSVLDTGGRKNFITVYGCGFLQFAEAVCVFDFRFTSSYSFIKNDNEIVCELPTLSRSDFFTLPQVSRLDVVFDGELNDDYDARTLYAGTFRWGPQLDCGNPFENSGSVRGHSTGQETLTIHGEGFSDQALSENLKVWIDERECEGASTSGDSSITCDLPPSSVFANDTDYEIEINKYSTVSVTWGSDSYWDRNGNSDEEPECYLHANNLYKYGPEVTEIEPRCSPLWGAIDGNGKMTIHGAGFNDPAFSSNDIRAPAAGTPTTKFLIEVTLDNNVLQVEGSSSSAGDQIYFDAPNFVPYFGNDLDDVISARTATVKVFYRQLNRWYSVNDNLEPLSFAYGPIVDGLSDNRNTISETVNIHVGPGDEICFHGCGFSNFSDYDLFRPEIDGNDACDGDFTHNTDATVCCDFAGHDECGDQDIDLEFFYPPFYDTGNIDPYDETLVVHLGPVLHEDAHLTHFAITPDQPLEVSGDNFFYTSDTEFANVYLDFDCAHPWCDDYPVGDTDAYFDDSVSWELARARWADTGVPEITFENTNPDFDCVYELEEIEFGPTCDDSVHITRIEGDETVVVDGEFFNLDYDVKVKLCDTDISGDCEDHYQGTNSAQLTFNGDISFATRDYQTGNSTGEDLNRGRRIWGHEFEIHVFINTNEIGDLSGVDFDVDWETCLDSADETGCTTNKGISCGVVRFGPYVHDISPCKGGIDGGDLVDIFAEFAQDGWGDKRSSSTLPRGEGEGPNLVAFGTLFGVALSGSDSAVSTETVWGAHANVDVSVTVFFDTCNMTAPADDLYIVWGPDFFYKSKDDQWGIQIDADTGIDRDMNENSQTYGDYFGFSPIDEGDVRVTLNGKLFTEYFDSRDATVSIDGIYVPVVERYVPTELVVIAPARPFGTKAKVCVNFGDQDCNGHENVFDNQLPNTKFGYEICSDEYLWYQPKLVGLTETHFRTSGRDMDSDAQTSTIKGLGLENFNNNFDATVFVGQYEAVRSSYGEEMDFELPLFSAEFNTHASVRVTWKIPDDSFEDYFSVANCTTNSTNHWSLQHPKIVHFGPSCWIDGPADSSLLGTNDAPSTGDDAETLESGNFEDDDDITNNRFTLSTRYIRDCFGDWDLEQTCDFSNSSVGIHCPVPQHSNGLQTLQTEEHTGIRANDGCIHRRIKLFAGLGGSDPFDNTDQNYLFLSDRDTVGTNGGGNGDAQIDCIGDTCTLDAYVPSRSSNIDCEVATFALYFPDVLVSDESQRRVDCYTSEGSDEVWEHYYGPSLADIETPVWYDGELDLSDRTPFDTPSEVVTIFGFGYTGCLDVDGTCTFADYEEHYVKLDQHSSWEDYYFENEANGDPREDLYLPYLHGSNQLPEDDDRNWVNSGTVTQSSEVSFVAWVAERSEVFSENFVDLSWKPRTGSNNDRICTFENVFHFWHGPSITHSSRDGCEAPVPIRYVSDDTEDLVQIYGHAFSCCGFEDLSGADAPDADEADATNCLFSSNGNNDNFLRRNYLRIGQSHSEGEGLSRIDCTAPANDQPDVRHVGFGLVFNSSSGTDFCGDSNEDVCGTPNENDGYDLTVTNIHETEQGYMDICYGPKLQEAGKLLSKVRLSGLDDDQCETDDRVPLNNINRFEDFDNNAVSSLVHIGRDDSGILDGIGDNIEINDQPIAILCRYEVPGEGTIDTNYLSYGETEGNSDGDETAYSCRTPSFYKQCLDDVDHVRVIHYIPTEDDSDFYEYAEREFFYTDASSPRWDDETGDLLTVQQPYGPHIWYDEVESSDTLVEFNVNDTTELRIAHYDEGENIFSVSIEHTEDWGVGVCFDGDSPNDWGRGEAMCVYHSMSGGPYYHRTSMLNDESYAKIDFEDLRAVPDSVNCYIPSGSFGQMASVSVLLDPHADKYTILDHPNDDNENPLVQELYEENRYWHWTAYIDRLSKDWASPTGLEPITIYGKGFCSYGHVKCQFGLENGYAVQGDILNDEMIVCQTPVGASPSTEALTVDWCGSARDSVLEDSNADPCDCKFGFCEEADSDSLPFTVIGVTDIWPKHGPYHGGTPIYLSNIGMDLEAYESFTCVFITSDGAQEVAATLDFELPVNATVIPEDGALSCVSPPVSAAQHVQVEFHGYYNAFETSGLFSDNLGCFWFDYGWPSIRSVSPVSMAIDEEVVVTVSGDYFNRPNVTGDTFLCHWQVPSVPQSHSPNPLGSVPDFSVVETTQGVLFATESTWNGRPFNDYVVVCITPDNFQQIAAYPFDISYVVEERLGAVGLSYWNFDVTASPSISFDGISTVYYGDDEEDDEEEDDDSGFANDVFWLPEILGDRLVTIQGDSFFGGRVPVDDEAPSYGYICAWDARFVLKNEDDDLWHFSVGTYFSNSTGDFVTCLAPSIIMEDDDDDGILDELDGSDDEDDTPDTGVVDVHLSVDGGQNFLTVGQLEYRKIDDLDIDLCSSASTFSIFSNIMMSFIFICFVFGLSALF